MPADEMPSGRGGYAIWRALTRHNPASVAVRDAHGTYSYGETLARARALSATLTRGGLASPDGRQPRVAVLTRKDHTWVEGMLAAWHAGAIAVPLAEAYPESELEYVLQTTKASVVIAGPSLEAGVTRPAANLNVRVLPHAPAPPGGGGALTAGDDAVIDARTDADVAYIIFTSGTTGRPKGVPTTHSGLAAQITALHDAWGWTSADRILNVLPLHHVHGVMGVALSALYAGAALELAPKFDAAATWAALTRAPGSEPPPPTLFMAVPTVYSKLLEHWGKLDADAQAALSGALRAPSSPLRLMVSGSAALPESVARAWRAVTGHELLERYGMTEFGLAISNPLAGPRLPGTVGRPVGAFEHRIVDETAPGDAVPARVAPGVAGELQLRGPGVFAGYWDRADASAEVFTPDGWFRTGDLAVEAPPPGGPTGAAGGPISIAGRISADIIKSGGYKISALDIERELLEHPDVAEVAVLGVPDATYGERVAAVIVRRSGATDEAGLDLKAFASKRLAGYKVPSVVRVVAAIPRNAMGKVNKKSLRAEMFPPPPTAGGAQPA